MAYVKVLNETSKGEKGNWRLCFQFCEYIYDNESSEKGYRFIWRKDNDNLQPARGQARIPSIEDIIILTGKAMEEGWGNFKEK